jgi:hypothetical protein
VAANLPAMGISRSPPPASIYGKDNKDRASFTTLG